MAILINTKKAIEGLKLNEYSFEYNKQLDLSKKIYLSKFER